MAKLADIKCVLSEDKLKIPVLNLLSKLYSIQIIKLEIGQLKMVKEALKGF